MKFSLARFAIFILVAAASAQSRAGYLGAEPPAMPQPFEPALLAGSPAKSPTCVAFAPGLRHLAVSAIDVGADGKVAAAIYETRLAGGEWSSPVRVAALGDHPGGEAAFSADGRWLYFSSDRPPGGPWRPRAFRAPVREGRIGAPELVPLEVADAGVYYPRPLANGDLMFTSRGPVGGDDLFIARAHEDAFTKPEPLGGDFNSAKDDWDLVESPDGNLRVWVSARDGGLGKTDLFYSRRDAASGWSPARNLAAANSTALETAPALTPDGEVLFFLRRQDGKDRLFWVRLSSVLEK